MKQDLIGNIIRSSDEQTTMPAIRESADDIATGPDFCAGQDVLSKEKLWQDENSGFTPMQKAEEESKDYSQIAAL